MLYKKKTVNVRPQTIATTPVVEQHHHDREVIVERSGWSAEAVAMATIAGLILFGLLLYYLWYRPTYTEAPAVIERNNTVIERPAPDSDTNIITPPPVVSPPSSPPVIVNPPANDTPDVNINTPPVTIENNTTPPANDTETDAGTDTTNPTPDGQ